MAAKHLRAAKPGEKPAKRPKTITQAASDGTHRELLVAMRDRIAKAVESPDCPPRDLASLTRRLHEIAKEIEQQDAMAKEDARANGPDSADDETFSSEAL